jgi:TP901 family phage tail tape measure protein
LIVASSKLAKLGMISTTEATKDLTSAIKGFKLSTEDAMSVVDKLTKIDQVAAISAGNLAEGLARVSTTAQQAGLSLDETAAMVTTITEVTQRDASTAGEALRTLISRYSNVKAGVFTSMGEEAEETSGNINDIEKVLGKLGIRIRTSGTEMRSIEDVLDELAEKWNTLDDVSRNAVASAFAGVRQRESFNILLSNWNRVKELTEESANAAGTADEKYSAYMDSMEAATKRLQNAWEGFTQSLETSTVMKFLTNTTAAIVENADKFKLVVTGIAAASSLKIFDFFTNKGETGGFKGLIANIPFIGRGTKTNNILESIDKKVGNIEKGVGADSIANQTKNGGLFKRIGSFLKNGFGFGDIYDPNSDTSISRKTLRLYKQSQKGKIRLGDDFLGYTKGLTDDERELLRLSATVGRKDSKEMMEAYNKLLKQRKIGNAAMGATSAVLTNLFTTKQVGGDIGGSFMKNIMGMGDNEQVVEETAGDKIGRTISSGILAGVGGYFLGPLGAMLGQTLGEGFASMFSTWYHRDELAMKQRVAEAKENLSALGDIKNAIENNEDLLNKDSYTSEDIEKLKTYADSLRKTFTKNDNLAESFLDDVKKLDIGTFTTIEDILSQITKGNADINKQLKRQLELTTARLTVEETLGEQEEDRAEINKYSKDNGFRVLQSNTPGDLSNFVGRFGSVSKYGTISVRNRHAIKKTKYGIQVAGNTIEEQFENAEQILQNFRNAGGKYNDIAQEWEKVVDEYQKQLNKQTELNNELLSTQVDYAYLTSDILNTKSRDEIRDLGMEGVVKIIRDELISQGVGVVDENGVIHQDAYDAIVKKIRSDSTLSDYITKDIRSIGDLISKDDIRGIESFARAFGLTTEAAKELGKQFGYLTQSMGLMNVQETTEYYEKLSTVFSNLSSNVALTAGQISSLLTTSELKDLLPYLMNQDDPDALIKELYKRIYGGGQDVHMENALYDATMGMSTDKFREYLQNKGLKEYAAEIDKGGYTTLSQIRDAVKEFDETDPRRKTFLEYLETINYTYSKDLTALEKPSEYIKSQLEEQINNLQEQKDALSQINDEREKELNLIKAKQALENARKEKRRVYRQGKQICP